MSLPIDLIVARRPRATLRGSEEFRIHWTTVPRWIELEELAAWPPEFPVLWVRSARYGHLTAYTLRCVVQNLNRVPSRWAAAVLEHLADILRQGGSLDRYDTFARLAGEEAARQALCAAVGAPYRAPVTPE